MGDLGLWSEDLLCGNNKLYNVLVAYANHDKEVSYVQSINYLAALLLFYIQDEELVFWSLYQLMLRDSWRSVYTVGFPKLQELTRTLESSLRGDLPTVVAHLETNGLAI